MSHSLHRQMARARVRLDHMNPALSEAERAACAREAEDGMADASRRLAEALTLVSHPVIDPVRGWRFRVMRRYRDRDHGDLFECIGESRTLAGAEAIARKEQGAAVVFEIGKQRFFNWQPTEVRA
jgi:hypothetical protein